jgi:transcriptional regulator GlxA family with amidase domain
MRAAILLFDGFDELDAIGPYEVLNNAARFGADMQVRLVTLHPQETVVASHGLRVEPDGVLEPGPELLVVPGGGWSARAEKSVRAEAERGELPRAIAALHESGATVAAVCTGGMLLAAAGITAGRPAVTHHSAIEDLRHSGAEVVETARVVDDGEVLTAGGVTSGIDLALYLVEREWGPEIANRIEREMEYERRGDTHVSRRGEDDE